MAQADDIREFRTALGAFATGVTIVTTCDREGGDVGLTANSFNSVSLDPPMVLWSLAKSSRNLAAFTDSPHFAVHILAADQQSLSDRFAAKVPDKFDGLEMHRNDAGVPLLDGCTAVFQCRTVYRYEGGDHMIFVGEVVAFAHLDKPPLVFHGGRYALARSKPAVQGPLYEGEFNDTSVGSLVTRVYQQLVMPLRLMAERKGLSAPERYAINLLLADAGHDLATINEIIAHTGVEITNDVIAGLVDRGLVAAEPAGDGAEQLRLTAQGRALTVELLAAAKAIEADTLGPLSGDDQRLLGDLLRDIVAGAGPGDERVARHFGMVKQAARQAMTGAKPSR